MENLVFVKFWKEKSKKKKKDVEKIKMFNIDCIVWEKECIFDGSNTSRRNLFWIYQVVLCCVFSFAHFPFND